MSFDWNEENIDLLTKRWADGASASVIASELCGPSRSSVIGKVHRLKLPARTKGNPGYGGRGNKNPSFEFAAAQCISTRYAPKPKPNLGGFSATVKADSARRPRSAFVPWVNKPKCEAVEVAPAPQDERADPPAATRCSLLELTDRRCRWPCGEPGEPTFAFCGAPGADLSDRRPYCRTHSAIAFCGRRK